MPTPTPKRGDAVTIHYTGADGKTYASVVKVTALRLHAGHITLEGLHRGTGELKGIDSRLDNQKAAIDRLLKHVQHHCPGLSCPIFLKENPDD